MNFELTRGEFLRRKTTALSSCDSSKKGSIDESIREIISDINDSEFFYTSSSCSGRIFLFCENKAGENSKKGLQWLLNSHTKIVADQLIESLSSVDENVVLKFEPFILHVQCFNLEKARSMHMVALESGFRNSGITIGSKGKITLAVRSTLGLEVPFGSDRTLVSNRSKPNELKQVIKDAVNSGYRHLDCAYNYDNQKEVGEAIKELIAEGKIKREDLFITSKCWSTFHSKPKVHECMRRCLADLGVEYLDLFLIHWPFGLKEEEEQFPTDENGFWIASDVDYTETWAAMEELYKKGLAKSIGISNFNSEMVKRILEMAEVKPVTNQVECHPYLQQKKLYKFCKDHGITITAYSPFGSPDRPWAKPTDPQILNDPVIKTIAMKYGKSTAQTVIRFLIQLDRIVIPKSVTKSRLEENLNVFDFTLSDEDIKTLESLDRNQRVLPLDQVKNHKYYPFNSEF